MGVVTRIRMLITVVSLLIPGSSQCNLSQCAETDQWGRDVPARPSRTIGCARICLLEPTENRATSAVLVLVKVSLVRTSGHLRNPDLGGVLRRDLELAVAESPAFHRDGSESLSASRIPTSTVLGCARR